MYTVQCKTCEEIFESTKEQSNESICYSCALESVTGGWPPEEGDFNTAQIISGTMTEQEWEWFLEDNKEPTDD